MTFRRLAEILAELLRYYDHACSPPEVADLWRELAQGAVAPTAAAASLDWTALGMALSAQAPLREAAQLRARAEAVLAAAVEYQRHHYRADTEVGAEASWGLWEAVSELRRELRAPGVTP